MLARTVDAAAMTVIAKGLESIHVLRNLYRVIGEKVYIERHTKVYVIVTLFFFGMVFSGGRRFLLALSAAGQARGL